MNETISFKRLAPSTISGEQIAITCVYSSFDKSEIDKEELREEQEHETGDKSNL